MMPHRISRSLLLLAVLVVFPFSASAIVTIDADNPLLQYFGRFDFSVPKSPRFDWPGTSIQARFTGPSLSIMLSGGTNDFNVIIDGVFQSHLVLQNGITTYNVATSLADVEHTLLLTKRTEGFNGIATFSGMLLADGKNLVALPPRNFQKLQFIGDSFTVGYGDEANVLSCPDRRPYDNNYMAYGPLTARALNAEYSVQAVSGAGMIHNYGDANPVSAQPLPFFFNRTLFGNATPTWNFASWIPDLVVIALGTNDFSTAVKPSQAQYTNAYKAFITSVRGYFPGVQILCMTYAVDSFQGPYVATMVQDLTTQGDTRIHTVSMPALLMSDLGCDYHPNLSGQQKYADALLPVVRQYLPTIAVDWMRGRSNRRQGFTRNRNSVTGSFAIPGTDHWMDVRGRILGR